MEKCADSDYLQPENEVTDTQKSTICSSDSCLSRDTQEKGECEDCREVPRADEEIASEERAPGQGNPIRDGRRQRTRRQRTGRRVNVLKKHATVTARQSVQKKTKINKSNVPDRLGKYVSCRSRSESKSSLGDGQSETKSCLSEASGGEAQPPSKEVSAARDGNRKTKIALLGNECLSNKEADRLRNSFESDSETKNIFEKFFDDCLDSTSRREGESSQEDVNGENRPGEATPEKRKTEAPSVGAPVKVKDHTGYYTNHKNVRHVCEYCHKIFKSNGKLNSHVYSHTGERPFDCSHCGKAFSSKFKLVRHLLIHSEVRKFVCQICDRTFLRNDHLKNHYKVHDPQKKMYKCPRDNCDKEYSSIMSHKKHMAYHHVEDGDLKCFICGVKYETKEDILFHLKSHSGSRLFKTQSDKKFKCDFCDRLFLTRKDVTRHLVVHTGERDFLCQFCPQRFGRKDHLVRHIKKSHGNEDFPRPDDVTTAPADDNNPDDLRPRSPSPSPSHSPAPAPAPAPDNHAHHNKTHILITLQRKPLRNSKNHHKPFHKNQPPLPNNKRPPSPNPKKPTTQILLQNVPNIFIIPNNSIILLRNQAAADKNTPDDLHPSPDPEPPPAPPPTPPPNPTPPPPSNDFINFNYDAPAFPSPSEFLPEFPDADSFPDFHPDLPPIGSHFDHPDFHIPAHPDLLPADAPPNGALLPDPSPAPAPHHPQPKPDAHKPPTDTIHRGLFGEGSDPLMLNDSILNDFKDDSSAVPPPPSGTDVGVLGDNCGFELLRHLLTTDSPVLSPLPGFSQIFHNSNANSN